MTNKQLLVLAAALSVAGISGCSRSADEPAPIENEDRAATPARTADLPAAPAATASPTPIVEEPITNASIADIPPEEPPAPDQQMLDDAAATGMTARASREDEPAADTTPAEQVEK